MILSAMIIQSAILIYSGKQFFRNVNESIM